MLGQPAGYGPGDLLGDALGTGVDRQAVGVIVPAGTPGEGGDGVEVLVSPRADARLDELFEVVEVHHGVHRVEAFAGDGGFDPPVVAVQRLERAVGQAEGVGGTEGLFDGGFVHGAYTVSL